MSSPFPAGTQLNPRDAATYYYNRTSPTTQSIVRAMKTIAMDAAPLVEQCKWQMIAQELKAGRYEVHEGKIRPKSE